MRYVTASQFGWNPDTKQGFYRLWLHDSGVPIERLVDNPAELCAIAAILQEKTVALDAGGFLVCGADRPGAG